jgi:hypothetical protein
MIAKLSDKKFSTARPFDVFSLPTGQAPAQRPLALPAICEWAKTAKATTAQTSPAAARAITKR